EVAEVRKAGRTAQNEVGGPGDCCRQNEPLAAVVETGNLAVAEGSVPDRNFVEPSVNSEIARILCISPADQKRIGAVRNGLAAVQASDELIVITQLDTVAVADRHNLMPGVG